MNTWVARVCLGWVAAPEFLPLAGQAAEATNPATGKANYARPSSRPPARLPRLAARARSNPAAGSAMVPDGARRLHRAHGRGTTPSSAGPGPSTTR